jgi:hypothetical protein
VYRAHAGLHRAERELDCLSALTHGFRVCVKAQLHSLEQMLVLPTCNPLLSPWRTQGFERTSWSGSAAASCHLLRLCNDMFENSSRMTVSLREAGAVIGSQPVRGIEDIAARTAPNEVKPHNPPTFISAGGFFRVRWPKRSLTRNHAGHCLRDNQGISTVIVLRIDNVKNGRRD